MNKSKEGKNKEKLRKVYWIIYYLEMTFGILNQIIFSFVIILALFGIEFQISKIMDLSNDFYWSYL